MTDDEMTRIARALRRRLSAASPEEFSFAWQTVFAIYAELDAWFLESDPDYLPQGFFDLIFDGYSPGMYG